METWWGRTSASPPGRRCRRGCGRTWSRTCSRSAVAISEKQRLFPGTARRGSEMTEDELRSVPLFEGLSDDAIRELSVWINEVMVPEGKHVVDERACSNERVVIME